MNAKLRKILMILAVVLVAVGAQSCLDDDDNDYSRIYPNAIVTMKNIDGATWFQLDDSTLLYPVNLKGDVLNTFFTSCCQFSSRTTGMTAKTGFSWPLSLVRCR